MPPTSAPTSAPAPWHGIGFGKWLFYRVSWVIWALINLVFFRAKATGHKALPPDGPYLLLPNHASAIDPFWAAFHLYRPVRFMATAHLFRHPLVRWPLTAIGGFPKMKFVKDRGSMETLARFYAAGLPILLFPEGTRSWDGRTLPVLPGIARLIKRLDARVVFVRNRTSPLFHPRWAKYPRFVPIRVEYDGPHTFPPEMTEEEILAAVQRGVHIDLDQPAPPGAWGWRMAHGLPEYLWACPACFAVGGLRIRPRDGNSVECAACKGEWRIDVASCMHGRDATPSFTVPHAWERIMGHFGDPPVLDRPRFEEEGVVLEAQATVRLLRRDGPPDEVGHGRLRLQVTAGAGALELHGPDDVLLWRLPLTEIAAISMEVANSLQVRTADKLYQLDPAGGCVRWANVMQPWWERAIRPKEGGSAAAAGP